MPNGDIGLWTNIILLLIINIHCTSQRNNQQTYFALCERQWYEKGLICSVFEFVY